MSYPLSLFANVNCNLVEKVAHDAAQEKQIRAEGFKLTTELWPELAVTAASAMNVPIRGMKEPPDSDESWQASEALLKKPTKGQKQ